MTRTQHTHPSRLGSVYLLVLGVSMVIVMIGVSVSHLARIQSSSRTLSEQATKAELAAKSAIEITLKRIRLDSDWRSNKTSGVWSSPAETIGDAKFVSVLQDSDGDLADDADDHATLTVKASVGGAMRMLSVRLEREPVATNLLTNSNFESGTSPWAASLCTISTESGTSPTGDDALLATLRLTSLAGPTQDVTAQIKSDTSYTVSGWVRVSGATRNMRARIRISTASLTVNDTTGWVLVPADTWTRFEDTLTPSWTGTLVSATLSFETDAGSEDLRFDNLQLRATREMRVAAGTWKREVLP